MAVDCLPCWLLEGGAESNRPVAAAVVDAALSALHVVLERGGAGGPHLPDGFEGLLSVGVLGLLLAGTKSLLLAGTALALGWTSFPEDIVFFLDCGRSSPNLLRPAARRKLPLQSLAS